MVRVFTDLYTAEVSGLRWQRQMQLWGTFSIIKTCFHVFVFSSSLPDCNTTYGLVSGPACSSSWAAVGGGHMEEAFVKHLECWLA